MDYIAGGSELRTSVPSGWTGVSKCTSDRAPEYDDNNDNNNNNDDTLLLLLLLLILLLLLLLLLMMMMMMEGVLPAAAW